MEKSIYLRNLCFRDEKATLPSVTYLYKAHKYKMMQAELVLFSESTSCRTTRQDYLY